MRHAPCAPASPPIASTAPSCRRSISRRPSRSTASTSRAHSTTRGAAIPTRSQLADALAELEGGARAVVTSTGMSAVTLVLQLLKPGDVSSPRTTATAARSACCARSRRAATSSSSSPISRRPHARSRSRRAQPRASSGSRRRAIRCFASPTFARVAAAAHAVGRDRRRRQHLPLARAAAADRARRRHRRALDDEVPERPQRRRRRRGRSRATRRCGDELAWWANCLGITGAPFDSYLTLRGVRTLHARIAAAPRERARGRRGAVASTTPCAQCLLSGARDASGS